MPTTCATCRAEVGDAAACPRCGTVVLSPQSSDGPIDGPTDGLTVGPMVGGDRLVDATGDRSSSEWRTDTAERRPPLAPVVPAPAASTPAPPRYPLFADELDVVGHGRADPDVPALGHAAPPLPPPPPPPPPAPASYEEDDLDRRSGVAAGLAWAAVGLVLVLVAVGGVWLLFSPGDDDTSAQPPEQARSQPDASDSPGEVPASDIPGSEVDFSGDAVDVATTAVASAPRTAPPNADAFGNRTTYDAANMLDGRPDTCWRTAGDATGIELRFRLASPTQMTRVGLVNGYAKNAVVGGRNLNWYAGNRRVLSAQWVFDDGTTVDQPLGATKQMQTIDLGERVVTSSVTLRLMAVSYPGTGRSARDYTAVSEVTLVGVPAA